ncbi:glutaredoxin family protein [Citricoccus sp. GCM10030269]|uniref:glutaredoxin family protein n=1 Tax=Citricoccus sp. GCM10030269 TaxID=3273388 RepID=UPI003608D411
MLTVTVYSTGPTCSRCTLTKSDMTKKGVPFEEIDITQNPAAHEYVTGELGYTEAPVCVVNDDTGQDHWSGFRPDNIARIAAINDAA